MEQDPETPLEKLLEVYTIEEILEENEVSPALALQFLIEEFRLTLPETIPL